MCLPRNFANPSCEAAVTPPYFVADFGSLAGKGQYLGQPHEEQ
jgi:hypothetical protein